MKKITGTLTGNLKISAPSPGERPQPHNLTTPRLIVTLKLSFRSYFRSEMKRKTAFLLHFSRLIVTLKLSFRSYFRSEMKRKTSFSFAFLSLNRNFAA